MKNLANCKPSEFLKQTNKIRKAVANWLTATDIVNIRKRKPRINDDMSDEEKQKALSEQVNENFNTILDTILDKHPDETLELFGLMCFVDKEHIDDYTVSEYLDSFNELMNDKAVLTFFTSLMSWESRLT